MQRSSIWRQGLLGSHEVSASFRDERSRRNPRMYSTEYSTLASTDDRTKLYRTLLSTTYDCNHIQHCCSVWGGSQCSFEGRLLYTVCVTYGPYAYVTVGRQCTHPFTQVTLGRSNLAIPICQYLSAIPICQYLSTYPTEPYR